LTFAALWLSTKAGILFASLLFWIPAHGGGFPRIGGVMAGEKNDKQLVREFLKGDTLAYEILIQRYSEKVFSLATRMMRNQEDAEEVLQDVFVTVFRKMKSFEGKSSFSSWLYRVTVNAALMKLRKNRQDRSSSMEEVFPDAENTIALRSREELDADAITLQKEVHERLREAIDKLPDDYRPVYILRDVDGLTSEEVGKILNLSIPAVKSRLHRSRLMLRRRLHSFYKEYCGSSRPQYADVHNG
jgi:RNA polymerase sigma-70 factor (ECF subfamily)